MLSTSEQFIGGTLSITDHILRAAISFLEYMRVLINVWSEFTIFHDLSLCGRKIHLYWEISQRLKEADIYQTLS